jgi:hypothetical protein
MKTNKTLLAILFGLSSALAVPAHAFVHQRIEAKIPFRFTVEDTSFPAGRYVIEPVGGGNPSALKIEKVGDSNARTIVLTSSVAREEVAETPKLVFDRRGRTRILRAVYDGGAETGAELNAPAPVPQPAVCVVATTKPVATARKQAPAAASPAKTAKKPAAVASR